MSANLMVGRKSIAVALTTALMLTATAVQAAKPQTTVIVSAGWSDAVDGFSEIGSVTVTQGPNGTTTLDFNVSRVTTCTGGAVTENWQGTTVATLNVSRDLAAATASGDFASGYSRSSTCVGVTSGSGPIGQVLVEGSALDRITRDRTSDGVRVLTRNARVTITFGVSAVAADSGIIEKRIG